MFLMAGMMHAMHAWLVFSHLFRVPSSHGQFSVVRRFPFLPRFSCSYVDYACGSVLYASCEARGLVGL